MWLGNLTNMGSMLMARSSDAKSTLPSTQFICDDFMASLKVRTRCAKTRLLDMLLLEMELDLFDNHAGVSLVTKETVDNSSAECLLEDNVYLWIVFIDIGGKKLACVDKILSLVTM